MPPSSADSEAAESPQLTTRGFAGESAREEKKRSTAQTNSVIGEIVVYALDSKSQNEILANEISFPTADDFCMLCNSQMQRT